MMRYYYSALSFILLTLALPFSLPAQSVQKSPPTLLEVNQKAKDYQIKESEEHLFAFELKEGRRYWIVVEQKGIDLVLRLTDAEGKLIKEQDSTNGNTGPEEIFFGPEKNNRFFLSVKPLKKPKNPPAGPYSIRVTQLSSQMTAHRLEALQQDFDLLVGSLK
ncbi:MAG TPA: PPC domain-containing protein, partial [Pyrinomonadaceae bacterium]|nr:PPC domain-containing protein [Pyrinomonadaceae bacterium]